MQYLYFIQTILGTKCYWLCVGVNPADHICKSRKSISTKSLEMMEEEGFAHFVKGAFEDNEKANMKSRNLHKGSSLPQP